MSRNIWLDNAKGVLIILVVFGHFLGEFALLEGNTISKFFYSIIYFFHMPLFIYLTGYFYNPKRQTRVIQLLTIYLIWQVINTFLNGYFADYDWFPLNFQNVIDVLDPSWTLWYLISVVIWFAITPYVLTLKHPLLIVLLAGLFIGSITSIPEVISLRRVLMFYPFFLLGYTTRENNWLLTTNYFFSFIKKWKWLIVLSFTTILVIAIDKELLKPSQFYMKFSYVDYEYTLVQGIIIQLILYVSMAVFSLAVLYIIPKTKKFSWLAYYGERSLYIYLTHTLFVRVFKHTIGYIYGNTDIFLLLCILATFLYLLLFRILYFDRLFRPLIQPNLSWLFK